MTSINKRTYRNQEIALKAAQKKEADRQVLKDIKTFRKEANQKYKDPRKIISKDVKVILTERTNLFKRDLK